MNNPNKPHLVVNRIVIAHYIAAAFTLLALAPMLLWSASDFDGHYFQPHLLAITHTTALGWATVIIFGVCYQLMPFIFDKDLYSTKLAVFGLVTFYLGMVDLVYAFWVFDPGLHMQCGSVLLLTGVSSFCANVFLTSRKITKPSLYQDFITTSCVWLLFTAVLGLLMVFNLSYAFLPQDHLIFLRMHAHAGLAGWFLLLMIGLSSRFLPLGKPKTSLLKSSYYLINISLLLFLVNTYLFGINSLTWFIASTALVGLACWLIHLYQVFRFSNYKIELKNTPSAAYILLALGLLVLAVLILPFIIFYHLKANAIAIRLSTIYGSLLLLGWLTSVIFAFSFKTLQFSIPQKSGSQANPFKLNSSPINFYTHITEKAQFLTFLAFIISFTIGIASSNKLMITTGVVCFSITTFLYIAHLFNQLFKAKNIY